MPVLTLRRAPRIISTLATVSPTLRLIVWPFHNGLPEISMGRGPERLATDEELRAEAERIGWIVEVDRVPSADPDRPEITRTFELLRRLAVAVREARRRGEFPLVLAGGCNSSIGTIAGIGDDRGEPLGVVWLDAHADFDRPEENLSGFLDVMGVSMVTGGSWQALCATVPGFAPVAEEHLVLAGARDLEPYQREAVERSRLRSVGGAIEGERFRAELDAVADGVAGLYLHLDLDVIDAGEATVNEYAAEGGPTVGAVEGLLRATFAAAPVRAAALTAWDPGHDRDGAAAAAARRLLTTIAECAYEREASSSSASPAK
jgi:arginase